MNIESWYAIHLKSLVRFLEDHWHVLTGAVLATWWAMVRLKNAILHKYATSEALREYDRKNTEAHHHIGQKIDNLDGKVDRLTETIIRHLEK